MQGAKSNLCYRENEVKELANSKYATAYNSTYMHRRPKWAPRAPRRCGAPLRHMALRPGWAQGHVTYVRYVMGNCARIICKSVAIFLSTAHYYSANRPQINFGSNTYPKLSNCSNPLRIVPMLILCTDSR